MWAADSHGSEKLAINLHKAPPLMGVHLSVHIHKPSFASLLSLTKISLTIKHFYNLTEVNLIFLLYLGA